MLPSKPDIRNIEKESRVDVTTAAICATGIEKERAEEIAEYADLAWGCASKHMRDAGSRALLQVTLGIPIFAYTAKGMDIVAAYSDTRGAAVLKNLNPKQQYLLSSPSAGQSILLGEKRLSLSEAALPVSGRRGPLPLM